jgi:hypothetical protein
MGWAGNVCGFGKSLIRREIRVEHFCHRKWCAYGPSARVGLAGDNGESRHVENRMVGILVNGDNHFIVRGPLPDREVALALVRHWSLIQIGATTPRQLDQWRISSREFRENLEWAVVVPGDGDISPAVTQLLDELSARGIKIHNSRLGCW